MKWSKARLKAALLRTLRSDAIALKVKPLAGREARISMEMRGDKPRAGLIDMDIHQGGAIPLVIHELLHFVLHDDLRRFGNLQETIVLALENELNRTMGPEETERWRSAIHRKLEAD